VNDPRRGLDALSADRAGVLVLGSVNLDLVLRSQRLPAVGETVAGAQIIESLGGKGANQAIAAARMGADVALIACVGDDAAGVSALATLRGDDVDVERCRVAGEPTGRAAVLVDAAGENLISVGPGANAALTVDDVRSAPWPPGARVLLAQLEVPASAVDVGLALARERGMTSCLNATPAAALDAVAEVPDVLIVNRIEAEQLIGVGSAGAAGTAAELAAGVAQVRGIATVVVTDGPRGAAATVDGGAGKTVSAVAPAVDVVDSTGAGDAFAGVLAASLAADVPLARALALGCAAGAVACTAVGAVPSLPRRQAVLTLAQRSR
jgi:ribokinase